MNVQRQNSFTIFWGMICWMKEVAGGSVFFPFSNRGFQSKIKESRLKRHDSQEQDDIFTATTPREITEKSK